MLPELSQLIFTQLPFRTINNCHLICRAWDLHLRAETRRSPRAFEGLPRKVILSLEKRYPALIHAYFNWVRLDISHWAPANYMPREGVTEILIDCSINALQDPTKLSLDSMRDLRVEIQRSKELLQDVVLSVDKLILDASSAVMPCGSMFPYIPIKSRDIVYRVTAQIPELPSVCIGDSIVKSISVVQIYKQAHNNQQPFCVPLENVLVPGLRKLSTELLCEHAIIKTLRELLTKPSVSNGLYTLSLVTPRTTFERPSDAIVSCQLFWERLESILSKTAEMSFTELREFNLSLRVSWRGHWTEIKSRLAVLSTILSKMPNLRHLRVCILEADMNGTCKLAWDNQSTRISNDEHLVTAWTVHQLAMLLGVASLKHLERFELDALIDVPVCFHNRPFEVWSLFFYEYLAKSPSLKQVKLNIKLVFAQVLERLLTKQGSQTIGDGFKSFLEENVYSIFAFLLGACRSLVDVHVNWVITVCRFNGEFEQVLGNLIMAAFARVKNSFQPQQPKHTRGRFHGGISALVLKTDAFTWSASWEGNTRCWLRTVDIDNSIFTDTGACHCTNTATFSPVLKEHGHSMSETGKGIPIIPVASYDMSF